MCAILAEAHLLALGALEERSRMIYNIGNGQGFTVLEVIESVRRVTGRPIAVEECERRAGDPAVLVASSEKIKRRAGMEAAVCGAGCDCGERVGVASEDDMREVADGFYV